MQSSAETRREQSEATIAKARARTFSGTSRPFAIRLAIEYGNATPTRNENDGWIMSCSEQPAHSTWRLVVGQKRPDPIAGECFCDAGKLQHLRHHEDHDEAAVRVDSDIALDGL